MTVQLSKQLYPYVTDAIKRGLQGWLSASSLQSLAPPSRDRTLTVSAENAPIPIVYGEVSVPGLIFAVGTISSDLVVGVAWGYGEFQAIDDIYINDEAVPISGVTVTSYLGTTTQTADATLASAIAAYADDMVLRTPAGDVGVAYSVFRITPSSIGASPRFQAVVRARKVLDPRTATVAYSANPALCWGDLVTNPVFGMGRSITGLDDAADWCDELLGGILPRCRVGLALTQPRRTTEYLDLLASYGELIWYWEGSDIVVIPDRALSFAAEADARGQNALSFETAIDPDAYARGDYFAELYAASPTLMYAHWTVGAGWEFVPGQPITAVAATSSTTQTVALSGETKYVARFSIDSVTAGSVALHLNGVEVIAAQTTAGDYSAIVTGSLAGPDEFELVATGFSGQLSGIELQMFIWLEDNCIAGTLSLEGADDGDTPTKVSVRYTAASETSGYWTDAITSQALPGVDEGESPLIESTLSLPGITRVEEANNKALARLQQMKNRVTISWISADRGIIHRKGDVVRHAMPFRGTDILARIQSAPMVSYGRYRISATRYDPAHYPSELVLPEGTGTIPVGAILPLSGSTVPDGWASYTAANGKYIVGAGSTYAPEDTGGDSLTIGPFSGNTSTEDLHMSGGAGSFNVQRLELGPIGSPGARWLSSPVYPSTLHDHTYSISAFALNPFRREQRLIIKTGTADTSIPKEAQVFGLPNLVLAGLSRVVSSSNRMLMAAAASADTGVASQSVGATIGNAGASHIHTNFGDRGEVALGLNTVWYAELAAGGTHSHSATLPVTMSFKRKTVALWGAGSNYAIIPGMIVLWAGSLASLPTDWALCDGAGVTPDLRDFFLVIAPEGSEDVAAGNNTIAIGGSTGSHGHSHRGGASTSGTPTYSTVHSDAALHHHQISISQALVPPYYALAAIMYSPS